MERLPVVDKCNLVMLAVTSEHFERMAAAPLCTKAVEPNEDDIASLCEGKRRRKKKF